MKMLIITALTLLSTALSAAPNLEGRFYAGASLGLVFNGGDDVRTLAGPKRSAGAALAGTNQMQLGYQFASGFALEGGFQYLGRLVKVQNGPGLFDDNYVFSEQAYFIEPLYRRAAGRRFTWGAGLGLAATKDTLVIQTVFGDRQADGSGIAITPELRGQALFGGICGLEARLGYRIADASPMNDSKGAGTYDEYGSGNAWHASNSGLLLGFGVNFYFGRAFRDS